MKAVTLTDTHGNQLRIQQSSSARESYWIYLSGENFPGKFNESTGETIPVALHLSRLQAEILISALQDFLEDNE